MMKLYICNKLLCKIQVGITTANIKSLLYEKTGLFDDDYYLLANGKKISNDYETCNENVYAILRVNGGKGGFGSMLRAIGAQIEKTTNREACRDLSGRRLRDINEEKRLKNWIAAQAEREKEAEDRKQKKLERLCQQPKHEFKDEIYDKDRSDLPEKVEDAVNQGMKASVSGKRKSDGEDKSKKKKRKLWIDDELDALSDELSEASDEESTSADLHSKVNENVKNVDETQSVNDIKI